ncbi:MAG: hypothetical protein DRI93_01260 [Aquificota bacterium]|nr:MAG: hypothetical protein DRI93_01260 [Aquificota bacterium]
MSEDRLFSRFVEEFEAAGGVLLYPRGEETLEEVLTRMVEEEGIKSYAISQRTPRFKVIDTLFKDLGLEKSRDYPSLDLGVTRAHGAGALTGTLVFVFKEGRDHLLTSLPRIHLAVLRREDLYQHVSRAVAPHVQDRGELPPYISLVTGPSRTGDIELTHVTGVHGPEQLYLVVVS